jgi:hypothetical protein
MLRRKVGFSQKTSAIGKTRWGKTAEEIKISGSGLKLHQHSAMKHPKQNSRTPQTHRSALAVPSYHRILVKHGLIEKTLPIPDAYQVFLKVGADLEVQKLRRKVEHGSKMKHVPALYLATAMALQGMTKHELDALKLRIEKKRV